jgi:hypothetical protein
MLLVSEEVMKVEVSGSQEKVVQSRDECRTYKLTRLACWTACISFALLEAWSQRQFLNEDGISYLDMSDALLRHNWHLLVNPIWSPLYPFLIGVTTWITRPSGEWEVRIVHGLNILIFMATLASFEFLLRQVIRPLGRAENTHSAAASVPAWTWQLLGYSLFAWSTLGMIWAPRMITPDLLVAMFVYLDAGLLLRLRARANSSRTCLLLGLTLGFGYLAKAVLFPMGFVFIVVAFLSMGDWRKAVLPLAKTCLVMGVIVAPLLVFMSRRVGRPSYGEAGKMNYVWCVNGFDPYLASSSGPPPYLKHPMTLLHRHPDVFAFREPIPFTYPPRQDMEYWSAGVSAVVNPREQIRVVGHNVRILFFNYHMVPMWAVTGAGLILLVMSGNALRRLKGILKTWSLLVPGAVAPCLYLLIWVEPRYVAPFLVLLSLPLFPLLYLQNSKEAARRTAISAVAIAISLLGFTSFLVLYHLAGFSRYDSGVMWVQVGKSLNAAGVRPGQEVGIIGDSSDGCRWARMARVRIVAQILRENVDDFWRLADPVAKTEVYDAFARSGATVVVAEQTPPSDGLPEWQRLGDTHYYVHFLVLPRNQRVRGPTL